MNIDTLNAYCSRWLVCLLCLAQGRFNIHQTFFERSALGSSQGDTLSGLKVMELLWLLPADSRGFIFLGLRQSAL